MADFTMCAGTFLEDGKHLICKDRLNCYRFTAQVTAWQSWFAEMPKEPGKPCPMFWDNVKYKNAKHI